ncbi:hypothetical protein [Ilumatobacter sp.]|uniref:hypothetical protein n=1 Tax=Ilumatobacter sp. TaxID=1967498 RepID=UPI003B52D97B
MSIPTTTSATRPEAARRPARPPTGTRTGRDRAAQPTTGGRPLVGDARAGVTIEVLEARGIWLALHGALVDGGCARVDDRFARLERLGFEVVVVDLTAMEDADRRGRSLLGRFVEGVSGTGGRVIAVDPLGYLASWSPRPPDLALEIIGSRPTGTSWLSSN